MENKALRRGSSYIFTHPNDIRHSFIGSHSSAVGSNCQN
ncbi:hypothetical protein EG68_12314 [Paragonimus skrjabini miyazakii]|uniref:Uncharacterized protein n=1 Tax=Paragonimus skrjabini miyazakii TaxID=59628 RepID=A0A8S9YHQ1_9TREM|nr:hypothetical protein EG68_12314 [Paragonimus skrjabini miyazakii]